MLERTRTYSAYFRDITYLPLIARQSPRSSCSNPIGFCFTASPNLNGGLRGENRPDAPTCL